MLRYKTIIYMATIKQRGKSWVLGSRNVTRFTPTCGVLLSVYLPEWLEAQKEEIGVEFCDLIAFDPEVDAEQVLIGTMDYQ